MMGLSAYLDFTDIAAKLGYTRDWETTEVPMGPFFREHMSEAEIEAAREAWIECLFSLPVRPSSGAGAAGQPPLTALLAEICSSATLPAKLSRLMHGVLALCGEAVPAGKH